MEFKTGTEMYSRAGQSQQISKPQGKIDHKVRSKTAQIKTRVEREHSVNHRHCTS